MSVTYRYLHLQAICDAAYEKVPNRRNGVIIIVLQRTYQGIRQSKNHSKIPSTFRDMEFLLEELRDQKILRNRRKLNLNIYQNLNTEHRRDCCNVSLSILFFRLFKVHCLWYYVKKVFFYF